MSESSTLRAFTSEQLAAEIARRESLDCTGVTASWCPVHGTCTCPPDPDPAHLDSSGCPLHDKASNHAEAERTEAGR